ncbi:MAG: carbohydrate binding domain-containing protein [Verrucomicrobiae bacterium]
MSLPSYAGKELPPADSEMAKSGLAPMPVVSKFKEGTSQSGYRMASVVAAPFEAKDLPEGVDEGVKLSGVAQSGGGKGDFTVVGKLDQNFKMIGAWFFISPDTSIQRIGFQLQEVGGEYFLLTFPADFTGWKWLEGSRAEFVPMLKQKSESPELDGVLDKEIGRISIVWMAKNDSPTEIGAAGITSTLE